MEIESTTTASRTVSDLLDKKLAEECKTLQAKFNTLMQQICSHQQKTLPFGCMAQHPSQQPHRHSYQTYNGHCQTKHNHNTRNNHLTKNDKNNTNKYVNANKTKSTEGSYPPNNQNHHHSPTQQHQSFNKTPHSHATSSAANASTTSNTTGHGCSGNSKNTTKKKNNHNKQQNA